ncbi:hypothetical protein QTL95_20070 [Rhizobium sp. S152]|uniref:hypothetical protein n=1 Tax=Rhizobium sp. S152 TaxID=3055038 RepID=UPI0025A993CB|nr:hypothetical protein [Rhizobium sp. S152]MDM9628193.1 hypothetical protein [Rhizobium sp. S152]
MKTMLTAIFVCVVGLFVGLAGLLGDWPLAKIVGAVSLACLTVIFWISSEVRNETLNRFLYGSRQSRDNKDA